jgi:hypothetical protein
VYFICQDEISVTCFIHRPALPKEEFIGKTGQLQDMFEIEFKDSG